MIPEDTLTKDLIMKLLIEKHGTPNIGKTPVFMSLVRAIVSQQLSEAAASTIFKRLKDIAAIEPSYLSELDVETFRSCGISSPKAGYIKAVSQAVSDGHLEGIDILSDEDAINVLIKLKGVGRWTAEMILIFALGREDVWPCDDAGLLRAAKKLYSTQTIEEFKLLGDRFKPYRSHAAWYLWCSLGNIMAAEQPTATLGVQEEFEVSRRFESDNYSSGYQVNQ